MDDIDDDDDDTVVGTCLHCNAPPPPRLVSSRGSRSSSANPGGGGMVGTCTSLATTKSNTDNILTVSSRSGTMLPANRVQVSCDDCRSFICDGCHWCHEFQANHEIRVCDRCDAFYCRVCDEMDQCEDCSEVVCNTCSTLMSCKFCGCGLCEDCATACGRCGIVLCARDAKFAVECDTCKMSYCLVCLASGTKDPCVRCGHRPSKRMEQLVHLRLKSIYKAFKQSGASMGPGPGNNIGGNTKAEFADRNDSNGGGKYSSALRSLLTDGNSDAKDTFSNFDQSMASEVAAVLQNASNSMADSNGVDYMDRRNRGKRISSHDDFNNGRSSSSRPSNAAAERYFRKTQAEMEAAAAAAEVEAEAAAAALLAELDEELETANTSSKKSKKKKKKKESKLKDSIEPNPIFVDSSNSTGTVKPAEKGYDEPIALIRKSHKGGGSPKATRVSNDDDSSDEEMNFEQLISRGKGPAKASKKDELDDDGSPPPTPLKSESPPPQEAEANSTAQFDKELAVLLSSDDEVGLETFLADLKGVPGLGAARKTARKALKRIKEANEAFVPPPVPVEPVKPQVKSGVISEPQFVKEAKAKALAAKQASSGTGASGSANANMGQIVLIHNPTTHEPLLKVVSRTQSLGAATTKGTGPNAVPVAARAECVMHISPAVVGWVIGKGGSRIRDMMEESGAKVWIDQESMAAKDLRVVYVSGKRSAVDTAVRMVKDLVSKAPAAASVATATGATPAPVVPTPPLKTSSVPPSLSATPEPASFAAAIASGATSGTSTPVVLTPPGPTPVPPKKQPPVSSQGWALPAPAPILSATPPSQVVPQIVMESSPPTSSMVNAGGASLFSQMISTEFRCDPRFVALLIGRRGWTVKNIQVESGANLRIDQSVDPPKIIISGNVEDVQKAEQMVRDVLKYPHAREPSDDILVDNLGRSEQQIPPMAVPPSFATTQQRVIPVSNHKYLEELQLQHESLHKSRNFSSDGGTSLPPMYGQFQQQQQQQQQQQNQGSMSSFQDSSAAARMSFILANSGDHQRQTLPPPYVPNVVDTNPNARGIRQEWGQQNQHPPPARNEYSAPLQQFSNNGHQYNGLSLPNVSQAQQTHQQSNQRLFSVPPPQEQRHFPPQNLQAVLKSHKAPAQAPPTRIHNFMGTSDILNRSSNEWELPTAPVAATTARPLSNNPFGNQSNLSSMPSAAPRQQQQHQPGFQSSVATTRPLSNNPFELTPSHDLTPAGLMSAYNNRKSDDSLMVDNLFAAMGTADSGEDLLSALNSVSLGGVSTSQQTTMSNTWDYKIPGWGEDDVGSNSRLGDYS